MLFSRNRDVDRMVKDLLCRGWVSVKKSKHWQVQSPLGSVLTIPSTPSDGRAAMNFRCDVKRAIKGEMTCVK